MQEKPFHQWKDEKIKELGGYGSLGAAKGKEWFWKAYGGYCLQVRNNGKSSREPIKREKC